VARVSYGSEVPPSALGNKNAERDWESEITITLTLYNAVVNGVPSPADVKAAISDLEALYAACDAEGTRGETGWGTSAVSVNDEIASVIAKYPYHPPAVSSSGFPQ
jgi:huntingtin